MASGKYPTGVDPVMAELAPAIHVAIALETSQIA